MVERPIKKSERLARAKENGGDASSPETQGTGQSVRGDRGEGRDGGRNSRDRGKGKGKGKGRGKDRDREERSAPVNPALVRGPRPVKIEPPKEEEVPETSADESSAEADAPVEEAASTDQESTVES